ncbi:MAG TPA: hypothetical protein VHF89_08960 [Solirubrobacteraceae bacterium]|nr:hypothetical protein [Solirubrobacteraceae bacterium]
MAKQSRADELFEMLRARGLRRRVARALSDAAATGRSGAATSQKAAQSIIDDLRKLADEVEERLAGRSPSKRSQAAKKAASTRARKATARSTAAKKAAATRAKRTTSSGTRKSATSGTRKRATTSRAKKS